jgi:hypothetical protein
MAASTTGPETQKRRLQRSPSYPAIGLADAIERARAVYRHEGRNSAPVDAVVANWGYSAKSSGGRLALAALKKYGLLDDEGSREHRQVRLTRLALTILLDERDESAERALAIQAAALAPPIHRELLDRYPGGLPSDQTLSHYLRLERAFTDGAVDEFIPRFRATLAFAGIDGATLSPDDKDSGPTQAQNDGDHMAGSMMPPAASTFPPAPPASGRYGDARVQEAPLPVNVNLPGGFATLNVSRPVSEVEWQTILAVLNASKPGLIQPPAKASVDDESDD